MKKDTEFLKKKNKIIGSMNSLVGKILMEKGKIEILYSEKLREICNGKYISYSKENEKDAVFMHIRNCHAVISKADIADSYSCYLEGDALLFDDSKFGYKPNYKFEVDFSDLEDFEERFKLIFEEISKEEYVSVLDDMIGNLMLVKSEETK